MFLVGLISWWYGRGWVGQWARMAHRFKATLDFFSVGRLLLTLFSPFRQISANGGGAPGMAGAFRAMVDGLISRVIGAIVRFFTVLFGLIVITFQALYELIVVIGWWFLPLLPIAGLVVFSIGWTPSWM